MLLVAGLGSTTYLVLGMVAKTKRGAIGMEAVPNIGFWRSLPGLAADGARYVWHAHVRKQPEAFRPYEAL